MTLERVDVSINASALETRPDRSERTSFWIALAIALAPIPAALAISWALGDPPWAARPTAPPGVSVPGHGPP